MLTQPIADRRAWTASTIDAPASWYYPTPAVLLLAFEQARGARTLTQARLPQELRAACVQALEPVRNVLETGRGFAIIEAPSLPAGDQTLLYWLVGQALGEPFVQNVQGTLLYDVRDTGQQLSEGARFSVTNYESSFHTDNSFGESVLDYVGLLCLNVAKSGGRSQIVSGIRAHHDLLAQHDVLATLYEPFEVERRGGTLAGQAPTIPFPVFTQPRANDLLVRYLRYWIEAGHEKIGQPLTAAQIDALDTLDRCLNRPEVRVEFDLKPGDMYFINNRWTLHNRTAFADHPEPERRRHLVRLWLSAR